MFEGAVVNNYTITRGTTSLFTFCTNLNIIYNMNEFINKVRCHEASSDPPVLRPFVGDPYLLSLPAREELVYRYQFLEESSILLAREYRLSLHALEEFFQENDITPQDLSTPEAISEFETRVNETYKNIRIRMSGLVALQSARAWESLARTEEHLLASLEHGTQNLHERAVNGFVDAQELKRLIDAHAKVIDRQQLIREAIKVPAAVDVEGLANQLSKTLEQLMEEIDGEARKLPSEQDS